MRWMHDGGFWGMGILMILFWGVLIAAVVFLVFYLLRSSRQPGATRGEESARELLDRRYARGELNRDQYQEMRRELEGRA